MTQGSGRVHTGAPFHTHVGPCGTCGADKGSPCAEMGTPIEAGVRLRANDVALIQMIDAGFMLDDQGEGRDVAGEGRRGYLHVDDPELRDLLAEKDRGLAFLRDEVERLREKARKSFERAEVAEERIARVDALINNLAAPYKNAGSRSIPSLRLSVGQLQAALDGVARDTVHADGV